MEMASQPGFPHVPSVGNGLSGQVRGVDTAEDDDIRNTEAVIVFL